MPASIALRATWLSCSPSFGRITRALTLAAISDSTAEICWLMSLVGSTGLNSTSEYCLACDSAFLAMAAIQPWSAAGAEKPMTTLVPGWSLSVPAEVACGAAEAGAAAGSLLVQALTRAPAPTTAPLTRNPRRPTLLFMVTFSFWYGGYRGLGTGSQFTKFRELGGF